jgi:hypothetical protein
VHPLNDRMQKTFTTYLTCLTTYLVKYKYIMKWLNVFSYCRNSMITLFWKIIISFWNVCYGSHEPLFILHQSSSFSRPHLCLLRPTSHPWAPFSCSICPEADKSSFLIVVLSLIKRAPPLYFCKVFPLAMPRGQLLPTPKMTSFVYPTNICHNSSRNPNQYKEFTKLTNPNQVLQDKLQIW